MNPLLLRQGDYLLLAAGALLLFGCIHRWLWRGRPNGAVPQLTWLLVLTVLGTGWFLVDGAARRERARMQQMVEGYAPTYAQEMALLGHAQITAETAADDPRYLQMIAAQKRWLAANPSINDIYTFRKLPDGRVALIVDSETDYNRDGTFDDDREARTAIGEVYAGDLADVIDVLLAGQPAFQAEPSTDRWGTWVSAAVPIRNAEGEVEAALGVDFDATTWVAATAQARHRTIGYLAVLLLFIAGGSGWMVHREVMRDFHLQALTSSEERLSRAFDACPLPIAILRLHDHGCVAINRAFLTATGYGREEMLGRSPWDTGLDIDAKSRLEAMALLARGEHLHQRECRIRTKTGGEREALLWIEPFELATGPHLLAIVEDVSEQRKLETQLRQSQKMEAVGHLAAGIAHDLNNVLTVIEGHTSLHLGKPGLDPRIGHSLQQVQSAGERAAALTRQLLAFSRKQVMQKRTVALSGVVMHLAGMLRRLIPENIALEFGHPPELPPVYADVGNLEQIVVNLLLNARDAMPAGGTVTIRTDTAEITPAQATLSPDARAGHFVRLTVSDTGEGMSAETMAHIFEPFFTTKEVGKGTGMGLATVLGIVQQHEGWIECRSTPGQGSTFGIYLPVTGRAEVCEPPPVVPTPGGGAGETILLVEDDDDVRALAHYILEDAGYRVLEAADGHKAIAAWRAFPGRIDLLLTDMVMPGGLSGSDVAERFRADRPESKVLFSSGYSVELFGGDLSLREEFNYLAKPYLAHQLTAAVARALAGTPTPEPAHA